MAAPAAWEEWLDAVCAQVRFKADRPGIRAELLAHLEDRETALRAGGWSEAEAQAAALTAMGDAAQVGAALDRAHSPLLGRLWLASVFVTALTLLTMALFFLFGDGYSALRDRLDSYGSRVDALAWLEQRRADTAPYVLGEAGASGPVETANGYRLAVESSFCWGAGQERTLYILLRADRPWPWSPSPDGVLANELWAVSSSGREHPAEPDLVDGTHRSLSCWPVVWDLSSTWYCIALRPYPEDEWVELFLPFGENDWTIRLTLPGGDAP